MQVRRVLSGVGDSDSSGPHEILKVMDSRPEEMSVLTTVSVESGVKWRRMRETEKEGELPAAPISSEVDFHPDLHHGVLIMGLASHRRPATTSPQLTMPLTAHQPIINQPQSFCSLF